jgi:hypothetical protein
MVKDSARLCVDPTSPMTFAGVFAFSRDPEREESESEDAASDPDPDEDSSSLNMVFAFAAAAEGAIGVAIPDEGRYAEMWAREVRTPTRVSSVSRVAGTRRVGE